MTLLTRSAPVSLNTPRREEPALEAPAAGPLPQIPGLMTPAARIGAGILGIGSYVPDRILTNADLEALVETSDEWIITRTGISERRIIGEDQATSDLAVEAARRALDHAGLAAADVELIIVATITPDMPFPAVSNLVQDRIRAGRAAAFDLGAGCSGFIYGLATGAQFIQSGLYRHVLVIGADALSRMVNWKDRSTCVLFGDGAGAAVLGPVAPGQGMLSFDLGSDGSGAEGDSRADAAHDPDERQRGVQVRRARDRGVDAAGTGARRDDHR
jgi:3-oxoacyl-[acyl-carrier-protein] synthase III